MADRKVIQHIDSRLGKRGKREMFDFAGDKAYEKINEYMEELHVTADELNEYKTEAVASADRADAASSAANSAADAASSAASSAADAASSAASSAADAAKEASNAATAMDNAMEVCHKAAANASESATEAGASATSAQEAAEEARKSAERAELADGVKSFNGRDGAVAPQAGDYTADMVGAISEELFNKTVDETWTIINSKADKATTLTGYGITDAIKEITISGNTVTVTLSDGTTRMLTTQDTTYSNATTSAAGLMSASDKSKLNGIATGATKVEVDSALSTASTNPVQNKVINSAITTISTEVKARPSTRKLPTQLLTAAGGTLKWTDSSINDASLIDVYASIPNITPSAISQSGTTVTVTFDAQDSAFDVAIVVMN